MPTLAATDNRLGRWLRDLLARAHKNTAVVALANKLARIVWAVLARGRTYEAAAVASRKGIDRGARDGGRPGPRDLREVATKMARQSIGGTEAWHNERPQRPL